MIPVIDVKFDECGIKFGWAGNQAVVYADPKILTTREDYDAFLEKLSDLPVPNFLKVAKESMVATGTDNVTAVTSEMSDEDVPEKTDSDIVETDEKGRKVDVLRNVKKALSKGTDTLEKVRTQVASKSEELLRNKSLMKQQMLFYGVVNLYNNGLEKFMNL